MVDSLPELLVAIRRLVIGTRDETIQERFNALDSLQNKMLKEPVGSERYDAFYSAHA